MSLLLDTDILIMARISLEEDQINKNKGSFAQDSSKTSHVTPDGPVVYDDMVCEWEMGEPEESPVRVMDGDGRGSPIADEEEDGSPEEEVATDLESAERRKMAEDGAVVGGSTKGKEDEKKASPKKKRRGRSRRQAQCAAEMTSGGWNITMETLLKYIPKVMLLLFVFTIFLPNTECSVMPVGDVTKVQPNLTCFACTDDGCVDKVNEIWFSDNDTVIWNKKMKIGSCDDGIQAGVPCEHDRRVFIFMKEGGKLDFEGESGHLNSSETECPPSQHPQASSSIIWSVVGILIVAIFAVFAIFCIMRKKSCNPNRNQENSETVQVPLQPWPAEES